MRIRTKLIVSYIAVIFFTIATISLLVFSVTRQAIIQHARNQDAGLSEQLAINLTARFKATEELQFSQYYYSLLGSLLAAAPDDPAELAIYNRKINDCLNHLCFSKTYIDGVAVIDNAGNTYAVNSRKGFDVRDSFPSFDTAEVTRRHGKPVWSVGSGGRLLMSRLLINVNNTRAVGYIMMLIDPHYLTQVYEKDAGNRLGGVVLFDAQGRLLPSTSSELDGIAANYLANGLPDGNFILEGEEYIVTRAKLPDNDFSLLNVLAVRDLNVYTRNLPYMVLTAALLAVLAAVFVAQGVSHVVTGNIHTLVDGIRSFASGKLSGPVEVKSGDEIGYLTMEFNRMVEDINRLIEDVYYAEMNKKTAELNALQFEYSALESKINPHFLYNTLESVNSLAKIKGEEDISEMVCLLGSLLRDNISSTADIIPLKQELGNIRKYLNIQKLTYGNKFEVDIGVEAGLETAQVPKFILQPLVENAIVHGILSSKGKGRITLRAGEWEGTLRIALTDNGAGIARDELDRLLDYSMESKDEAGTHTKVGVRAVDKRLKILYGNRYGLTIGSEKGKGTEIVVSMPLQQA